MRMAIWLAASALAAAGGVASADEVVLRNGDRLSGTVLHVGDDKLKFRTPYAGEIELDWREVAAVTTDGPVRVVRRGESEAQKIRLGPGVPLADIVYVNPEPHESGLGTTYRAHASLAASYVRGNAQSDRFYADGELTARARLYRYTLSGRVERRSEPPQETNVAWLARADFDRFLTREKRFVYARTSLEHDRLKDIERRATLGGGYGVQLIDKPSASVSLRGGIDYVSVERTTGDDEAYPALGWAFKADGSPWGWRARLFHEDEGFWDLEDTRQLFIRTRTGLRLPLVERVSATAQLNLDWERQPAPGRKATDTTLLLGLTYSW